MEIAAPHIGNLLEYASYRGIPEFSLRNCLVNHQLDLCSSENSVSESEFLNILSTISEKTSDKYLGLHYGCYLNLKALGFINQLSLNANNLEQAVFILQNYLQSTFPIVRLLTCNNHQNYILKLESEVESEILRRHVLDITYCFIYRELCLMMPSNARPVLTLSNSDVNEYYLFLNSPIAFNNAHSFIFEKRVLSIPINQKRIKEIQFLLPKFLQLLDTRNIDSLSFSNQIRNVILSMCRPELPTFRQVAVHFPLSQRTIQRKLLEEGLSFRKISDNIKSELANFLIKDRQMKTQDIALILGYSDSSAYLHAAKKWRIR